MAVIAQTWNSLTDRILRNEAFMGILLFSAIACGPAAALWLIGWLLGLCSAAALPFMCAAGVGSMIITIRLS